MTSVSPRSQLDSFPRPCIAASMLAADWSRAGEEIEAVDAAGVDVIHLDVMDGHFVPNITFGFPLIEALRKKTKKPFDAHLMIENADRYLEAFGNAGCNWLSVHVEACPHLNRTLSRIRELGMQAGVAVNPGTSLQSLDAVLDDADFFLLMSVNPGFGGQKFIPSSLQRISELKARLKGKSARIQVDGGVKEDNAKALVTAGADILVVGTGIFGQKDYRKAIANLRS